MNTRNYTDANSTTNNGTNIIIKQVFITVDPEQYVTWDALFMFIIQTMLWYWIITTCIRGLKRRYNNQKSEPAVAAVIVQDSENGTARIVQVTDE